jgi:hypothetical protein
MSNEKPTSRRASAQVLARCSESEYLALQEESARAELRRAFKELKNGAAQFPLFDWVKRHPVASAGVAIAAGVVVSRLVGRPAYPDPQSPPKSPSPEPGIEPESELKRWAVIATSVLGLFAVVKPAPVADGTVNPSVTQVSNAEPRTPQSV